MTWWRQALMRFRRHMLLKTVGTTAFITLFFVGYFHVLRNTVYEVTLMPLTALDHMIGFQPAALIAYVSLWFYVGIPPALLLGFRELVAYGAWIAALCITALVCFHFWPTAIPAHVVDSELYPGFGLIQGMDASGNACPSLHVATAAFSAIWLDRLLREIGASKTARAGNWIWFWLIAYSTLAIKQHVTLDVLAGLLLGIAFALPSLRNRYHTHQEIQATEL
jgi:membrane-associated phospholipid phosphatase